MVAPAPELGLPPLTDLFASLEKMMEELHRGAQKIVLERASKAVEKITNFLPQFGRLKAISLYETKLAEKF